jgi:predicted DNA-binding antitoxin AbrB/MazE fold protein
VLFSEKSNVNALVIEATYQKGVLKLDKPLPLKDNQRVRVTVESATSWTEQTYGMVRWAGDVEVLERMAMDPELAFPPSPEES